MNNHHRALLMSRNSSVSTGFESRQGQAIYLFSKTPGPVLGPTQPPVKWAPGLFSRGQVSRGAKLNHLHVPSLYRFNSTKDRSVPLSVNTAISRQKQDLTYLRYQEIFAVDTASLNIGTQSQ